MKREALSPRIILAGTVAASCLPFLILTIFPARFHHVMDRALYLLFHNVTEFFSIMVSLSIFGVGWYTYSQSKDRHALLLSGAFLAVGLLDTMHTLGNAAMPPFITPNSSNKSTQFWIAARLFSASALLLSAFVYQGKQPGWLPRVMLSRSVLISCALAIPLAIFTGITFYPSYVPDTFVPGVGLTHFKIYSEYVTIFLLCIAAAVYWRRMVRTGDRLLTYYVAAFIISIFSELVFAGYKTVFDTYNVLGHIYKIVAFYLIYKGIFVASVKNPYAELSRTNERLDGEIAERKEAQEALQMAQAGLEQRVLERTKALSESEQRWVATLASIGDAVIATDASGNITFMNAVAEELTGWKLDEAAGKPSAHVFHIINEQTREEVLSPVSRVLREGMVVGLANHTILVKKDGTEVPIDDSGAPVRDKEGDTRGVVLVFRDITERRQAEEELRKVHDALEQRVEERTEQLREAYESLKEETREREQVEARLRQSQKLEALGTLAGGIAHDFNNLLGAVIGFTELLQEDLPPGNPGLRHAARVMEAGMRGRDLVKQMLTFSRKTELEKKPLRLSTVVKETVKLLRASIPTTISIDVNVRSESGLIMADPVQIQQVLMNLCTNAYYAMRETGGTLDIELSDFSVGSSNETSHGIDPGFYMKLSVKDTGIGIPAQIRDRIFDPFFTTKAIGEGTGLGLSVVMGIVKQSGGYITVNSEPGKGSTFAVYFPKVAEAEAGDIPDRQEALPVGSERILFVDDEEALLEMGEQLLMSLGYKVKCSRSSTAALATIAENPSGFDLVITDQTMPDMIGVELAKKILVVRPDMPIILCTGFSHLVDADSAKAAGISAFVMKPLTKQELASTVRRALDQKSREG